MVLCGQDGGLDSNVVRPHTRRPVADGQEVLGGEGAAGAGGACAQVRRAGCGRGWPLRCRCSGAGCASHVASQCWAVPHLWQHSAGLCLTCGNTVLGCASPVATQCWTVRLAALLDQDTNSQDPRLRALLKPPRPSLWPAQAYVARPSIQGASWQVGWTTSHHSAQPLARLRQPPVCSKPRGRPQEARTPAHSLAPEAEEWSVVSVQHIFHAVHGVFGLPVAREDGALQHTRTQAPGTRPIALEG